MMFIQLCTNSDADIASTLMRRGLNIAVSILHAHWKLEIQSTVVISNSKGLAEILQDISTSTNQICKIEEKIIRLTTFNKHICNWTLEVRDLLKIL